MNAINELAEVLRNNDGQRSFTFNHSAILAFEFFRDMAKKQVIDEDTLSAIINDARSYR